ncbi:hypothetical protein CSB07_01415 [Candidatus Gracilibacteria bacterium]|nr:MAG: hypothetical protein CSB07_01415 [Candidatus Gracilibacteria bacterium]PIE85061.1 MAG: hypothetical protein CSA08_03920 [Candidatus Gracilibacteria bacterium]
MKKLKKTNLGEFHELEKIGEYCFGLGIPENQIKKIIKYSNDFSDKSLQENTSDSKRFSSLDEFEKWYNYDGRFVFSLLGENSEIIGFWQSRPSKEPIIKLVEDKELYNKLLSNKNLIHTNGIRIYPNFRSKGLSRILLSLSHKYYKNIYPNSIMSVDINKENIPSQKSYEKMGYKRIGIGENQKTVESKGKTRIVYCYYE